MATYKKSWSGENTGTASWSTSGRTSFLTIDLKTNGYQGVEVTINVDAAGGTDDFDLAFLKGPDGTDWDELAKAFYEYTFATPGTNETQKTFTFVDVGRLNVYGGPDDNTDDMTVTYTWDAWNWTDA